MNHTPTYKMDKKIRRMELIDQKRTRLGLPRLYGPVTAPLPDFFPIRMKDFFVEKQPIGEPGHLS